MARRNRLDLYAGMLEVFGTPSPKSTCILDLDLSGSQSKRYFNRLLRQELVAQEGARNGTELYKTTEKGEEFLMYYNAMKEMLGE